MIIVTLAVALSALSVCLPATPRSPASFEQTPSRPPSPCPGPGHLRSNPDLAPVPCPNRLPTMAAPLPDGAVAGLAEQAAVEALKADKLALGYLGMKCAGTSTFPFSHIRVVPPNEDLPLALGGTVCVSIADACRLRECNRLNLNLKPKQQKGAVRCPKDVAEFAQYAVRDPSSEFFEGFRCSEVEGTHLRPVWTISDAFLSPMPCHPHAPRATPRAV